jgi:hypothetical protein
VRNFEGAKEAPLSSSEPSPTTHPTHLQTDPAAEDDAINGGIHGFSGLGSKAVTEITTLLKKPFEFVTGSVHGRSCNYGTFSPRPESRAGNVRSERSRLARFGGRRLRMENLMRERGIRA